MTNTWVIDVLKDLRTFAKQNGYAYLAAKLDETVLLAANEVGHQVPVIDQNRVRRNETAATNFLGHHRPDE